MKVRIKKLHPNALVPTYAKPGDACFDLTAVSVTGDSAENLVYDTGLAFEIPQGYVGLVFPRSSISKTHLMLRNAVGVIDSGYRGSVTLKMKPLCFKGNNYLVGDRVGQMMILPIPSIKFEAVDELTETERGTGGYGSTGN